MLTLEETFDYARKAVEAKKVIGKLSSFDEMIVLLFNEVERLNERCVDLQEEVVYYAERDAGSL